LPKTVSKRSAEGIGEEIVQIEDLVQISKESSAREAETSAKQAQAQSHGLGSGIYPLPAQVPKEEY